MAPMTDTAFVDWVAGLVAGARSRLPADVLVAMDEKLAQVRPRVVRLNPVYPPHPPTGPNTDLLARAYQHDPAFPTAHPVDCFDPRN